MKDLFVKYIEESDSFTESEREMLKGLWKAVKMAGEVKSNA